MKAACLSSGNDIAQACTAGMLPLLTIHDPTKPAAIVQRAITSASAARGRRNLRQVTFGSLPARAAIANATPAIAPAHHVAIPPQASASNVKESVFRM